MLTPGKFSEKETLIKTLMASIGQGEKNFATENVISASCISQSLREGPCFRMYAVKNIFFSSLFY